MASETVNHPIEVVCIFIVCFTYLRSRWVVAQISVKLFVCSYVKRVLLIIVLLMLIFVGFLVAWNGT